MNVLTIWPILALHQVTHLACVAIPPIQGDTQMRKLMIAAAFVLAGVTAAAASEVNGTISAVDPEAHSVTLTNGQTFWLNEGRNVSSGSIASNFRAGDKVKILYRTLNFEPTATSVSIR
jgi:hypothetical protein